MSDLDKLLPALAQAQAAYPKIGAEKTGQVGTRKIKYLDMVGIMKAVRKPNTDAGLIVLHLSDTEYTETRVVHVASGQYLSSRLRIDPNLSEQSLGMALTYCRRYCLTGLLGIVADEDTDGREAEDEQQARRSTRASTGVDKPSGPPNEQVTKGGTTREKLGDAQAFWAQCYAISETGNATQVEATVRVLLKDWGLVSTKALTTLQRGEVLQRLEQLYAPPPPSAPNE